MKPLLADRTAFHWVQGVLQFGFLENLFAEFAEMSFLEVQPTSIAEHGDSAVLIRPSLPPKWRRGSATPNIAANIRASSTRWIGHGAVVEGPLFGESVAPRSHVPLDFDLLLRAVCFSELGLEVIGECSLWRRGGGAAEGRRRKPTLGRCKRVGSPQHRSRICENWVSQRGAGNEGSTRRKAQL